MGKENLDYTSYLRVDEIISQQVPLSEKSGRPAHDEMFYIIIHQVYELWFKSILFEIDSVRELFAEDYVNEKNIGVAVSRLNRVIEVLKLLNAQIKVIETMTPLDFLDFRDLLGTASGFQSFQFRLLENRLGMDPERRIKYGSKTYIEYFDGEKRATLEAAEKEGSMFSLVEAWLERTPFLSFKDFDFEAEYGKVVDRLFKEEIAAIDARGIEEEEKQRLRTMVRKSQEIFTHLLDQEHYDRLTASGSRRISRKAALAALFINLYRDEPILHLPFKLLESIVEIDEQLTNWRSLHSVMVLRMLGRKMGTGESSGYDYLKRTADRGRIFSDFYDLSTCLVPRSLLPELPGDFKKSLAFHYSVADEQ